MLWFAAHVMKLKEHSFKIHKYTDKRAVEAQRKSPAGHGYLRTSSHSVPAYINRNNLYTTHNIQHTMSMIRRVSAQTMTWNGSWEKRKKISSSKNGQD